MPSHVGRSHTARFAARALRLNDGRCVALRNACREDAPAVAQFVRGLSAKSRRNRFFAAISELSPGQIDRITQTHDARELTLIAEMVDGPQHRIVALAQHALCEPAHAEFAIVVGDAFQRQGLGARLIHTLAEHAARARLEAMIGLVLADNRPMLAMLERLGFEISEPYGTRAVRVMKALTKHLSMTA